MAMTEGSERVTQSEPQKRCPSSEYSLHIDYMKVEPLVTVYQNATVNTFPGIVHTARHLTKAGSTGRGCGNPKGG